MEPRVGRRNFLRMAFWSGIALGGLGGIAAIGRFLYPKPKDEEANRFVVLRGELPAVGGPPSYHETGNFYVVNLAPGEGEAPDVEPGPGGILALSRRCTHLNCGVKWEADFDLSDWSAGLAEAPGAFACRCHDSFFTKAGLHVKGPAPRSLDTPLIRVLDGGHLEVDMQRIARGGPDNPMRTVQI